MARCRKGRERVARRSAPSPSRRARWPPEQTSQLGGDRAVGGGELECQRGRGAAQGSSSAQQSALAFLASSSGRLQPRRSPHARVRRHALPMLRKRRSEPWGLGRKLSHGDWGGGVGVGEGKGRKVEEKANMDTKLTGGFGAHGKKREGHCRGSSHPQPEGNREGEKKTGSETHRSL